MSTLSTTLLILGAWLLGASAVGVVVSRAIRRREQQVGLSFGGAHPALVAVRTDDEATAEQVALRRELKRLLAGLDRAEFDGRPGEVTDLCRIWAARSAIASAEQELNQAIKQARDNGRSWETIRLVLELPEAGPLGSAPDHQSGPRQVGQG